MSITFIAVQCCECSTMQVKQRKKSSNKWSCVICNQKQSVLKIFAQAFQAKDVRKFVTSFNMSRKSIDETLTSSSLEIDDPFPKIDSIGYQRKRSNWTEYLDPEDKEDVERGEEELKGGGSEPEVVTGMPKEMFKKPRLKNYSAHQRKSDGNKLFSPIFSERKTSKPFISHGKENETQELKESKPTIAQGPSKWSDYLTEEDDEKLLFSGGEEFGVPLCPWSQSSPETRFEDEIVAEVVHPEFT